MPRPKAYDRATLVREAMGCFWEMGFRGTSIGELVRRTGVSRHGLYCEFPDKDALFHACMDTYQAEVVSPAFGQVEAPDATIAAIVQYFSCQIDRGSERGLPGPGCLVANTATELGPHDERARKLVRRHHDRLRAGFRTAIANSAPHLTEVACDELAEFLVTSAQGLWSFSRTVNHAEPLRRYAHTLMTLIEERLEP
ncbi:MAG: TetR/AcrR family transcriptional regulator [Pseudomonadota bacterium]